MKTSNLLFCIAILLPIIIVTTASMNLNNKANNYIAKETLTKSPHHNFSLDISNIKYVVVDSYINVNITVNNNSKAEIEKDHYDFQFLDISKANDTLFFMNKNHGARNYSSIDIMLNDINYLKAMGRFQLSADTLDHLTIESNLQRVSDYSAPAIGDTDNEISFKKINTLTLNGKYLGVKINSNTRRNKLSIDQEETNEYFDEDFIAEVNTLHINGESLECTLTNILAKNRQFSLDTNSLITFEKHAIKNMNQ